MSGTKRNGRIIWYYCLCTISYLYWYCNVDAGIVAELVEVVSSIQSTQSNPLSYVVGKISLFLGVCGFQSRSLILKSQNKRYRPVFFRKVGQWSSYLCCAILVNFDSTSNFSYIFEGGPWELTTKSFSPAEPIKSCLETGRYSGMVFVAPYIQFIHFIVL